jgi:hypothetical protein
VDPKIAAILAITELIAKYGVPTALQLITAWEVEDPTVADWDGLRLKAAEEYFPPKPGV